MTEETKLRFKRIRKILVPIGDLVLATASNGGRVHICVMSYVLSRDNNLLMSCEKTSSKVKNIRGNPRVGMSLFEKQEKPSLLMYGIASILEGEEARDAFREIISKAPRYEAFTHRERCFIKVKIRKIIYEYYGEGGEYFEVKNNFKLS